MSWENYIARRMHSRTKLLRITGVINVCDKHISLKDSIKTKV